MSDYTKYAEPGISWTQSTWNPWMGCTKVSPGCAHCYMFTQQARYGHNPAEVRRSKTTFNQPLRWKEGRLIFTCSWSDWFHADADEWRDEAWAIIKATPQHTYQILTKRPERIAAHLPADWGKGYPNVWLGTSTENQAMARKRIPLLLAVPAAVRFISAEPLLGPIDLTMFLYPFVNNKNFTPYVILHPRPPLDWVIVGGESGAHLSKPENAHRWMQLGWAESILWQCEQAGVAVWMKQVSGLRNEQPFPEGMRTQQFPFGWEVQS